MTVILETRKEGQASSKRTQPADVPTRLKVIDSDLHPCVRSIADLKPFMTAQWWEHLNMFGPRLRYGLSRGNAYPKAVPNAHRRDARPPSGGLAGSDLDFMRKQYLEPCGIEYAIMNPLISTGQGDDNHELSAAMCRAINEWQVESWTRLEPRLRASIVVPYEDSALAVAEIKRWADHPDFSQVLLLTRTSEPLGRRRYWPIYEAAAANGLPVGIHVFGASGHPTTPAGWPSYYMEDMVSHSGACQGMLASFALEGVFERIPDLKIISIEGGFAWLPSLEWRLDKHWSRMRQEVPSVKRPPSEYLREHVFVSTQPIEEPENPKHLIDILDWVGYDRILFATDYPHWDFDDPASALPRQIGQERLQKIFSGNARGLYRLP
jgi:uncharacterized protein